MLKEKKTVVITGAGGTICSEIAKDLAQQGMVIILLGRTKEKLASVENVINLGGGEAYSFAVDVTDIREVTSVRDEFLGRFQRCDVLINGAGGKLPGSIMDTVEFTEEELQFNTSKLGFFNCDLEVFRKEIDLNLMGTMIPSQIFGEIIAKSGGGSIINFASMASFRPLSKIGAYNASKAGVVSFTQWLAAYLAPVNIRVNAIAPGFIINERSRKLLFNSNDALSARGNQVMSHTPMKRFGEPEDIVGCVRWLIDDKSAAYVTGITVPIDGGFLACPGT